MSDPDAPRNGTIVGAARDLGKQLMGALPPAFLMLLLINLVFLLIAAWHDNQTQVLRAAAINKLLDHCLAPPR